MLFVYTGTVVNFTAEELKKRLEETDGQERAKERAILLLQWNGKLTAEYLKKDTGVNIGEAIKILEDLEKEGIVRHEKLELH